MTIRFVAVESDEWNEAWHGLGLRTGGDLTQECECCGEQWQYMGTVQRFPDGEVHQFRHRHWPTTGQRKIFNIEATS